MQRKSQGSAEPLSTHSSIQILANEHSPPDVRAHWSVGSDASELSGVLFLTVEYILCLPGDTGPAASPAPPCYLCRLGPLGLLPFRAHGGLDSNRPAAPITPARLARSGTRSGPGFGVPRDRADPIPSRHPTATSRRDVPDLVAERTLEQSSRSLFTSLQVRRLQALEDRRRLIRAQPARLESCAQQLQLLLWVNVSGASRCSRAHSDISSGVHVSIGRPRHGRRSGTT